MDYNTGKSRGFGFVHFKDPEVEKIVLSQVHHIQGRTCEVTLPRSNYKASASVIFHVVAMLCSLGAKLFCNKHAVRMHYLSCYVTPIVSLVSKSFQTKSLPFSGNSPF